MKKFKSAITGKKAAPKLPVTRLLNIDQMKNAAFAIASHFIFTGIMKNSLTDCSGNNTANAKNNDRLRYIVSRIKNAWSVQYDIKPQIIFKIIPNR